MKIKVKHKNTKIILEEFAIHGIDKNTTMRWDDQNKQIQETLTVIFDQIVRWKQQ